MVKRYSEEWDLRDVPGGPGTKISPSNARGMGSIPGQGAKDSTCLVAKKP